MQVLAALTDGRTPEPEQYDCVTIIFCDIMNFNEFSATLQPQQVQPAVVCPLQRAVVAVLHWTMANTRHRKNA